MTTIADMDMPGSVTQAAYRAYDLTRGDFNAALRAALQAMCDCGMASLMTKCEKIVDTVTEFDMLIIRLTSDERKREET